MPPVLKKQILGLPAWAWLGITTLGIGAGIYLRKKKAGEGEEENPTQQNEENPLAESSAPGLVEYTNGETPEASPIIQGGGGGGIQSPSPFPGYEAGEIVAANEGGVELGNQEPGATVNVTNNVYGSGKPCNKKNKPKARKGFTTVCANGHWAYEPKAHAGKTKDHPTHNMTGGGPPKKQKNKHKQHGARR